MLIEPALTNKMPFKEFPLPLKARLPLPILVRLPGPEMTPPSAMLPAAALMVCAPVKAIGTFTLCALAELFTKPPDKVSALLLAVPMVNPPAPLSNDRDVMV